MVRFIFSGLSAELPQFMAVRNVSTSLADATGCMTATSPGEYLETDGIQLAVITEGHHRLTVYRH